MMWCNELNANVGFCSGQCNICDKSKIKIVDNYKCSQEFSLPFYDEYMNITEEYGMVEVESMWEVSDEVSEGDIRLINISGDSDFPWIDISFEHLKEYFTPTN